jgi:hypothetical protein
MYRAVCRDCDWERELPEREMVEHAKRVHEDWADHTVVLD